MMQLKSCPRCHGDMIGEDWLGETELVCIQCGHRMAGPAAESPYAVVAGRGLAAPVRPYARKRAGA